MSLSELVGRRARGGEGSVSLTLSFFFISHRLPRKSDVDRYVDSKYIMQCDHY